MSDSRYYTVEVEFDRINPKTRKLESSKRFGKIWASDEADARKKFLAKDRFRKNEKTRRRIHKVSVTPTE